MGACAAKMKNAGNIAKNIVGGIDHKAIEMNVKAKKIDIAHRIKMLSDQYSQQIAGGQVVNIPESELLPVTNLAEKKLTTKLDASSSQKDIQRVALYVCTNTIFRNQFKKECWTEMAAGMKVKKIPEGVIAKFEPGCNVAVDKALDSQVSQMDKAIENGDPLVTHEEENAVKEYNELKAKEAAANKTAGEPGKQDMTQSEKMASAGGPMEKDTNIQPMPVAAV
jgi:hypothetical protein